jgi:hypothetical protein
MSMIGGALGVLMFIWASWLNIGVPTRSKKYAGFAFGMPTTAVIGLSLAAGLMALLGARERRCGRVPSAIPTALAASSLLLAIGIVLGKGSISPELGDKVGTEIRLILGLITALAQTIVLAAGLGSRREDEANTRAPVLRARARQRIPRRFLTGHLPTPGPVAGPASSCPAGSPLTTEAMQLRRDLAGVGVRVLGALGAHVIPLFVRRPTIRGCWPLASPMRLESAASLPTTDQPVI